MNPFLSSCLNEVPKRHLSLELARLERLTVLKTSSAIGNLVVLSAVALLLCALGLGCSAIQRNRNAGKHLFSAVAMQRGEINEAIRARVVRYRFVAVNFHVIAENTVELNLFEDATFTAVLDRREVRSDKRFTWLGHIEGIKNSQVTIVVEDGVMASNIILRETHYQIRYAGEGVHVIYQIDPRMFPREAEPVPVPGERK